MSEVLKKFGRYFLLDRVAQGGMAEIYRARLASADGAGRLLVVKRIQSGYGANVEFVQMFKSEIKVTMGFNHPNIVQLYDFGEEQQQPFIAMEFVDGKNLRQFLSKFAELKQHFPIDLAAYVIEQSAGGLHYAHTYKDKISGEPLNIIHRDISPQNLLISFEGSVKVIDFGIAKASTNSEATRAGIIKGKPSYLSPEQISGETLDGRCDVFALGIVLWELLTGKKLFAGDNDLAVLKLIESCTTHIKPPSHLNPRIPEELDNISLKALTKSRDKRYQTAEEFRRALHKFIYSFNPDFNPGDLAYYAKDLFKHEIVEDRKRVQKLSEKAEQLLADIRTDYANREEAGTRKADRDRDRDMALSSGDHTSKVELVREDPDQERTQMAPLPAVKVSRSRVEVEAIPEKQAAPIVLQQRRERPTSSAPRQKAMSGGGYKRQLLVGAALLGAVAVLGPEFGIKIPFLSGSSSERDSRLGSIRLEGDAHDIQVSINGQLVARELPARIQGIRPGLELHLVVAGAGGNFQDQFKLASGEEKVINVQLGERALASKSPPAGSAETGTTGGTAHDVALPAKSVLLKLNITPIADGVTVILNGRPTDPANLIVSLDAPLELVAEKPGYRAFRREFVLDSRQVGAQKQWPMDVPLEPSKFGFLTVRTTPSSDVVLIIDGKEWVKRSPFENEKLPVGSYQISMENKLLSMGKKQPIQIQEGKAVSLDVRLDLLNDR